MHYTQNTFKYEFLHYNFLTHLYIIETWFFFYLPITENGKNVPKRFRYREVLLYMYL